MCFNTYFKKITKLYTTAKINFIATDNEYDEYDYFFDQIIQFSVQTIGFRRRPSKVPNK